MHDVKSKTERALFGGGCFWCLDAIFSHVHGVLQVVVGYAGGAVENPSYKDVSTGSTRHAEVVEITFDPVVISYRELMEIFFSMHDPTTKDRQGADIGLQYRSIIIPYDEMQRSIAQGVVKQIQDSGAYPSPVVTEIVPFANFYPAEEYHQKYFKKNPTQGYCQIVIGPKMKKFKETFEKYYEKKE